MAKIVVVVRDVKTRTVEILMIDLRGVLLAHGVVPVVQVLILVNRLCLLLRVALGEWVGVLSSEEGWIELGVVWNTQR